MYEEGASTGDTIESEERRDKPCFVYFLKRKKERTKKRKRERDLGLADLMLNLMLLLLLLLAYSWRCVVQCIYCVSDDLSFLRVIYCCLLVSFVETCCCCCCFVVENKYLEVSDRATKTLFVFFSRHRNKNVNVP